MFNKKQFGQSSILGVAFALMIATGIYTLYNTSRVTADKTQLVNATDAAVYSSGVHVARNLNYIAYTNRAMISNHVAVGHLTSYWSWLQYAEQYIEFLDDFCDAICSFIPYVGPAIDAYVDVNEEIIGAAVFAVDDAAGGRAITIASEGLNTLYSTSQQFGARLALIPPVIQGVQDDVLQSFGSGIERQTVAFTSGNTKLIGASTTTLNDMLRISTYAMAASPVSGSGQYDDGVIKGIVERSVEIADRARGDRYHFFDNGESRARNGFPLLFFPFRARKEGLSEQQETNDGLTWYAEDSLDLQLFNFTKFRYETVAEIHQTSAETQDDFVDSYRGIPGYTSAREGVVDDCYKASFSGQGFATGDCFKLTLISKRSLSGSRLLSLGSQAHAQAGEDMYAVGRAEIFFERPFNMLANFSADEAEFANLFNPFWKVRLSD